MQKMPANKPTHHGIKCYLQYTVLSITALLRQHLMDGKILYATTCPWTSASRRWRTRWAVPPERAVFGHSILQRSIKWRKRCRNGNAKISQPSVAAWPIQVSYRRLLSSFIDIFALTTTHNTLASQQCIFLHLRLVKNTQNKANACRNTHLVSRKTHDKWKRYAF